LLRTIKQMEKDNSQINSVKIKLSNGDHVLQFSIEKTAFQLGDIIKGTFDMTDTVHVVQQISVWLDTIETISNPYRNQGRSYLPSRKQLCEHHEYTTNSIITYFMFQIPSDAAQEFASDLVNVTWVLRVEITMIDKSEKSSILNWELPIKILVPKYPAELRPSTLMQFPLVN